MICGLKGRDEGSGRRARGLWRRMFPTFVQAIPFKSKIIIMTTITYYHHQPASLLTNDTRAGSPTNVEVSGNRPLFRYIQRHLSCHTSFVSGLAAMQPCGSPSFTGLPLARRDSVGMLKQADSCGVSGCNKGPARERLSTGMGLLDFV